MSEVNGSALSRVLDEYSLSSKSGADTEKSKDLGRNEFLKLLVAQLENQDPTKPQENGEFIAQLATFSSLEEQQKLTKSFDSFAGTFQSSQHLQATSLVGRPVHVESDFTALGETGAISVIADIPHSTSGATLNVTNSAGEVVDSFDLGPQESGQQEFIWTGSDADDQRFPPGMYNFKVTIADGTEAAQVPTYLSANVNSVTIEPGGSLTLNLAGIGPTPLAEVKQIN
ncbi:MAG: flagellar hook assembly protein FlgD [Pseudohongiellaceae bacterium]|nr:flagellar hook assembly protein FlgD [Pseudohongiellaceae bacterium]